MGWNAGYKIFEATVVGAYDLGKLDKDLLSVLMEPYRNTDIDSGGRLGLMAKDGKDIDQIVIETWGLEMPQRPDGEPPGMTGDWTEWDEYYDTIYNRFCKVTEHFGWL